MIPEHVRPFSVIASEVAVAEHAAGAARGAHIPADHEQVLHLWNHHFPTFWTHELAVVLPVKFAFTPTLVCECVCGT